MEEEKKEEGEKKPAQTQSYADYLSRAGNTASVFRSSAPPTTKDEVASITGKVVKQEKPGE